MSLKPRPTGSQPLETAARSFCAVTSAYLIGSSLFVTAHNQELDKT